MSLSTDVKIVDVKLYLLPVKTRVPLKFGSEALTSVTCARVAITVEDREGKRATGWGETPLSVQWVWPSELPYDVREKALIAFSKIVGRALIGYEDVGHPIEIGYDFQKNSLGQLTQEFNDESNIGEDLPHLASLVCLSAFDIALHDAYGVLHEIDVYDTYNCEFMNRDLCSMLTPADDSRVDFNDQYPDEYLYEGRTDELLAWHLVGGLDPLETCDLTGDEPDDGYPVLLGDWILSDGLSCLKIKLRGTDAEWDNERIVRVGEIALKYGCKHLSVDFNCTVTDPQYVVDILDRLSRDEPEIYELILYVEQPFPYDLRKHMIKTHEVSKRKPLLLDESAHDWTYVKLGRELGWSGVALKTCKTQTGALLSLCWAKAHDMPLMVQDLTNPMLAMIPHARLACHAETIAGVETNACQFYPEASKFEAKIHPGIYRRRFGTINLTTLGETGFGYRLAEIDRELPAPEVL